MGAYRTIFAPVSTISLPMTGSAIWISPIATVGESEQIPFWKRSLKGGRLLFHGAEYFHFHILVHGLG